MADDLHYPDTALSVVHHDHHQLNNDRPLSSTRIAKRACYSREQYWNLAECTRLVKNRFRSSLLLSQVSPPRAAAMCHLVDLSWGDTRTIDVWSFGLPPRVMRQE